MWFSNIFCDKYGTYEQYCKDDCGGYINATPLWSQSHCTEKNTIGCCKNT